MTTIIRRYRRRHSAPLWPVPVALALASLLAWGLMVIWTKGGPQPVHEIVIAIPAPQMPHAMGRRA